MSNPEHKENAASEATDNGAISRDDLQKSHSQNRPKKGRSAMALYAKERHKRVAKALGYVLTLGTQAAWWGLVPVLVTRLNVEERAALAFMALSSLDEETAYDAASAALFGSVE